MASVWYIGGASARIIDSGAWAAAGHSGRPDSSWDPSNGFSIAQSVFTSGQLALLDDDPGFVLTATDGPRPGATPEPYEELDVSRGWVVERVAELQATLNANAPGLSVPAASGGDDTAMLRDALVAAAGKRVYLQRTNNYTISAPLDIYSGTTLDMNGAKITLAPGSNCQMLRNASVSPQRTVTGASISGVTLTATGLGSYDVGRAIVSATAGPSSTPWCARILSVESTTSATLDDSAPTAVTGVSVSVHSIDTGITIINANTDRGGNAGTGNNNHSLFFRHVDGLVIRDFHGASTSGKYQIFVGDDRGTVAENMTFNSASDGIHFIGPSRGATVRHVRGYTGDNTVAFGTGDYLSYQDISGPIQGITIDDIEMNDGNKEPIRIFNIQNGQMIRDVLVNNLRGIGSQHGMTLGSADTGTTANIRNVKLRNISIRPVAGYGQAYLNGSGFGDVLVDGMSVEGLGTGNAMGVYLGPVANVDALTIRSVMHAGGGKYRALNMQSGSTCSRLVMDGINLNVDVTKSDGRVANISGSCPVMVLSDIAMRNGGDFVFHNSPTKSVIYVSNADLDGTANGIHIQGAVAHDIYLSNIRASVNSSSGLVRLSGSSVSGTFIRANTVGVSSGAPVYRSASQTVRINGSGMGVDLTLVAGSSVGDQTTNTNAALSCGLGPCMWNGTAWVSLATGATFTP